MPLDIARFRSNLIDGGARPSLFQMEITGPLGLNFNLAPYHIRVASIPPTTVTPIVQKFAGRELKFAGQRTYPNLSVTILNDEGFTIRRQLETWMNAINERTLNTRSAAVIETLGSAVITQYAKTGSVIATYQFTNLFPVTMAEIALDWSQDGAIEEYTVEFAYDYYTPDAFLATTRSFAPGQ